jgi:hypothetical protein
MGWFARNSAAIQAIASLLGIITTAVLVAITFWYVRVTRQIAESSVEQVRLIKAAAKATQQRNVKALGALAASIRNTLAGLEPDEPRYEQFVAFNQIAESDIAYFQVLASQVDSSAVLAAASAVVVAIREIFGAIQRAKLLERKDQWFVSDVQLTRWKRAKEESDRRLHEIEKDCAEIVGS